MLESNSVKIIHAGALGDGAKLKFCINLITYIQWAAAYESFQLAKAIGLRTKVLEEAGQANGQLTQLMVNYLGGVKLPEAVRKSEPIQKLMRNHMTIAEKDLAGVLDARARRGDHVARRRDRLAADGAALRRRGSRTAGSSCRAD